MQEVNRLLIYVRKQNEKKYYIIDVADDAPGVQVSLVEPFSQTKNPELAHAPTPQFVPLGL